MRKALITIDPEANDQIYREVMEIFRADLPVTFLFPATALCVAHRRLHGLSTPYRIPVAGNMEYAWIEDEEEAEP